MSEPSLPIGPAAALTRLARERDPAAWESLATALGSEVQRICRGICGDAQLAQDAVQETWLLLRDQAARFAPLTGEPDADARRWVLRVAANSSLQLLRRRRREFRRQRAAPEQAAASGRPEDGLVRDERAELVREALAELPEPMRAAIALHHLGGLAFDQVAMALKCPVGTAKIRVHRGIARLRRRLQAADATLSVAVLAAQLDGMGGQAASAPALPRPGLTAPISATVGLPAAAAGVAAKLGLAAAIVVSTVSAAVITMAMAVHPPAVPLSMPGSASAAAAVELDLPAIPQLAAWQDHLLSEGRRHARWLHDHRDDADLDRLLLAVNYDAAAVFFHIAERTGDRSWEEAAADALHVYRDRYLAGCGGDVDAYQVLPDGLEIDARHGSDRSRAALLALARARLASLPAGRTEPVNQAQIAAEMIRLLLAAERLGAPSPERLRLLVEHALGHLRQWRGAASFESYQLAVTARSLIEYDAAHPDPRIAPALLAALDWLWEKAWMPGAGTFRFIVDAADPRPGPDVAPLIAPAYAWAYRQDGGHRWLERADAVFTGGVAGALIALPKQFNQSYWWSFDYVAWRQQPRSDR